MVRHGEQVLEPSVVSLYWSLGHLTQLVADLEEQVPDNIWPGPHLVMQAAQEVTLLVPSLYMPALQAVQVASVDGEQVLVKKCPAEQDDVQAVQLLALFFPVFQEPAGQVVQVGTAFLKAERAVQVFLRNLPSPQVDVHGRQDLWSAGLS